MDAFEVMEPLALPSRAEVLAFGLSLPEVSRSVSAADMAAIFGAMKDVSAATRIVSDLAFFLTWEMGGKHHDVAQYIGKGYKRSSASRRRTLRNNYPQGSEQLVARIRDQYLRAGGQLDAMGGLGGPVEVVEQEPADQ